MEWASAHLRYMKNVHLIQHTHWDREWYFTENDSKALLYYFMDDLASRLENDPALGPFTLDAQTVVLDDYLEIAPENKQRITKLIQEGRILIGPWYSQTDFLVVSAESMTRNLLLGINDAEKFGPVMNIGYVPDSFGQMEQLPMLLNEFDIDRAVIWRGWSEHEVSTTEFNWQSENGSSVTAAVLPWGYGCAKWLPTEPLEALPVMLEKARKQSEFAASECIMLPNGNDQSPFEYQVPGMLDKINAGQKEFNFINSSFEQFFDELQENSNHLPLFKGELLSPKYMRIHRGIFSTRMDIKLLNAEFEKTVSRYLEPLLTLNMFNGLPYPQNAVNNIWREAMKSHAHDSIGCCNSDRVNSMVANRLQSGIEVAQQLIELNFKKLCDGIKAVQDGTKIIIFNSIPKKRDSFVEFVIYTPQASFSLSDAAGEPVRYQITAESKQDMSTIIQELSNETTTTWYRKLTIQADVKDIPAYGYKTIYLNENLPAAGNVQPVEVNEHEISNEWLQLKLNDDASITLTDKRSGIIYSNVFELVDGSDEGDNYNFSPLQKDCLVSSIGQPVSCRTFKGELSSTLKLSHTLCVPKNISERRTGKCTTQLLVELELTIAADKPFVNAKVIVHNNIEDHRIQLLFPTQVSRTSHCADQPFGLISRENRPAAMDLWEQEKWTEAPVALYPMQSTVIMNDQRNGLAVVADGIREYQIHEEKQDCIAVTLLRSVGWLGQADLTYRPGRASGMVLPSPDSQIQGSHEFELTLIPQHNGSDKTFWKLTEELKTEPLVYVGTDWSRFRMNKYAASYADEVSLFEWDTELHFSTIKKAENSDDMIIRAYNPSFNTLETGTFTSSSSVCRVNLAESRQDNSGTKVLPCTPVTLKVEK